MQRFVDVNGDGMVDWIHINTEGIVHLANGNGGFKATANWRGLSYLMGVDSSRQRFADVNGDGLTDWIHISGSGGGIVHLASNPYPDLLSAVSNGYGSTTTITYTPSSAYPYNLLPFILQTVSSISVNDGYYGIISTTNYTYSGGLYNYANREFRGFQFVKSTDPAGAVTENWFHQMDVYKGIMFQQDVKDPSGNSYTRIYNTYQNTSPYTGINFPYLAQKDDYVFDGTSTYKQATTTFGYDAYGNITRRYALGDTSITGDEKDEYITYNYDTANWQFLPIHTYTFDSTGIAKAQTIFTYDVKGNLLTKTAWLSTDASPVTTYTYDIYGNQISVIDPNGNTTTITYDAAYQTYPVQTTKPYGQTVTAAYDNRFGKPTSETDSNNNTTIYEYDVFGRLTKVTNPNDTTSTYGTTSYFYLNFGAPGSQRIVKYHTKISGASYYFYEAAFFDGLGRIIKTRSNGPDSKFIVQETAYEQRGLVTSKSLPYFEGIETPRYTAFIYDLMGRITQVNNPDGATTKTSYDKGRITRIDANDHKKVKEKDVYGRLIKVEEYTGAAGSYTLYAATTYQYDILGNLLKTIDAAGNQINITYDTLSRKTSMTDPDMGTWIYTYDANGNLKTQKDDKNQTITFTYDALNRITKKDYPAGTDTIYMYDELTSTNSIGRLTTIVDASGMERYYYDKLGRTTKTIKSIDGAPYTTNIGYDAMSRITRIKYPDGEIVTYTYDTGSNLKEVTGYATYSNYNAIGQPGTVTYANGAATTYNYYNSNNRLYFINVNSPTAGLMNISYNYDSIGNITNITDYIDSAKNQTFTYDNLDRLTQAQSASYGIHNYTYNQIGNITTKQGINYTYGAKPHAVTSTSDGKTYTYDANGNMTEDTQRTITYNYDNMPDSINYQGVTTQFIYDGNGNRVKKITPTATTRYIGKLYECAGGTCAKYIFAGDNRIAKKTTTETLYYHQDHLGSSSIITDQAANKIEEIYYLPYGETWTDTNSAITTHKYTGQEEDTETGLYYYGARYYNPSLGRFISADSIVPNPRNPQAFNRYTYVRNNPLIYTDPTGNSWLSETFNENKGKIVIPSIVAIGLGDPIIGLVIGPAIATVFATVALYEFINNTISHTIIATAIFAYSVERAADIIPNQWIHRKITENVNAEGTWLDSSEHSDIGSVAAVNIKGVFHGKIQMSWTKDRNETVTNPDGSQTPMHTQGGPFRSYKVRVGEGKSELQSYQGFRPTATWSRGGNEGDGGPTAVSGSHWLKDNGYGNLGFSLRVNKVKNSKDYDASEW